MDIDVLTQVMFVLKLEFAHAQTRNDPLEQHSIDLLHQTIKLVRELIAECKEINQFVCYE